MGWSAGSEIADKIWDAVSPILDDEQKITIGTIIRDVLDEGDWDTHNESEMITELMELDTTFCLQELWVEKGEDEDYVREQILEYVDSAENPEQRFEQLWQAWRKL